MPKKILALTNGPKTLANLENLITVLKRRDESIDVTTGIISNVFFSIDGKKTKVIESVSGKDIKSFDLVIFRTVGKKFTEEALAISIYCDYHSVKFIDSCVSASLHKSHKLASMMALWADGLNVPMTMCGPGRDLREGVEHIGLPAIVKATSATHGAHNYKIESADEISAITESTPDKQFLLQEFIENEGDYRILVVNGSEVNVELRKGNGTTHVNNESAGGTSTYIKDTSNLQRAIKMAKRAARVVGLEVAGVDVIIDSNDRPYIIEINRAPQLTSQQEFDTWADGVLEIIYD